MKATQGKKQVLISGASIAGLSTAYWMNRLGYAVTVVELSSEPRTGGAAVNIGGAALDVARRMGLFEQLDSYGLYLQQWEYKNTNDATVGSILLQGDGVEPPEYEIEIERDKLVRVLFDAVKSDVEFIFNDRITALNEIGAGIIATFKNGSQRAFDLVLGCDGLHSGVRRIWFGHEAEYSHFLEHYFSLTIVNKTLIRPNTAQMYNVPGKGILLNAYNGKTDIAFGFFSEKEIPYDYRDADQQRRLIEEQFAGMGWRSVELLEEVRNAGTAYFDKFCQIIMPSWTKGRVALIGDAGYCPSPGAGMGASVAMVGAATLADSLERHQSDFELAFHEYNHSLRPYVEEVQSSARTALKEYLIPPTEEAIQKRNASKTFF